MFLPSKEFISKRFYSSNTENNDSNDNNYNDNNVILNKMIRVAYRYSGTDRNRDSFRKEPVFYRFVENRY